MPVIRIDCGPVAKEKKSELVAGLTETASKTLNIPRDKFIVIIGENSNDNIGVNGMLLTDYLAAQNNK